MSQGPRTNYPANRTNNFGHSSSSSANSSTPPAAPPRGIDVIVQLCIAVIYNPGSDGRPTVRVVSPYAERIPVLLDHVRSFAGVRRVLRILLSRTLTQYGLMPIDMTHCAAQLPLNKYANDLGLLKPTVNDVTWQNYMNTVASMYHAPCDEFTDCEGCRNPAFVIACFPATAWTTMPDLSGIVLHDEHCEEHGQTLRELSSAEEFRYARIMQDRLSSEPATTVRNLRLNSNTTASPQPNVAVSTDPTRGPKGRSLLGTSRTPTKKVFDYSQGTLFPATAEQGIKAESDTCLTCIRYGRKCKGTTMKFVKAARADRKSQWKCPCCQDPSRRCVWRPSMDKVTSYEEAFLADGGKNIAANTVQGRKDRAMMRSAEAIKIKEEDDYFDESDQDNYLEASEDVLEGYEEDGDYEKSEEVSPRIKQEE